MSETGGRLKAVGIFLLFMFSVCESFLWSNNLQDSAFVAVCVESSVSLPWNFTLQSGETIQDIKWNFRSQNGTQQVLVAMFVAENFVSMPPFSRRVQYFTNGGLKLTGVTSGDAGNYSIEVTVRVSHQTVHDYTRTAIVEISDGLHVRQEPDPVYDQSTGSWHVTLSCGTVVNPDGSPDQIEWQTPKGTLNSTRYRNGRFYLQLENPVKGGNYACTLSLNSTVTLCPAAQKESIQVDETAVRFSLLEAEVKDLRTFKVKVAQLEGSPPRPISFHARPDSHLALHENQEVILSKAITNQGNAYNPSTGRFLVPVNGTYFFAATAGSDAKPFHAAFSLMVDDRDVCYAESRDADARASSTCTATVRLIAGQRVWLKNYAESFYYWYTTTFTGFLVSAD